jgi:hypothetical protein
MLRIDATQRYIDSIVAGISDLQELSKVSAVLERQRPKA